MRKSGCRPLRAHRATGVVDLSCGPVSAAATRYVGPPPKPRKPLFWAIDGRPVTVPCAARRAAGRGSERMPRQAATRSAARIAATTRAWSAASR
jgi:hypothetical protein